MRFLAILLTLIALNASAQLYYKSEYQPPVFENGWSPPKEWRDSLGYIDITDGKNLASNTVKMLVDTRIGSRAVAFALSATGGYKVKWGKGESWVNYNNGATASREYDTTKCQKYCVIEIKPQTANNLVSFNWKRMPVTHTRTHMLPVLWYAANYPGSSPTNNAEPYLPYLEAIYLKSITSMASYAFAQSYNLKSVTMPSSCTNWSNGYGYYFCYTLRGTLTIPSGVTQLGTGMFSNCVCIEAFDLPSTVTTIGSSVFTTCASVKSLTIPSSVTSIGSDAFSGCTSLTELIYTGTTNAQDHGVQSLDYCENLLTLNWPGLKTTRLSMNGTSTTKLKLGSAGNIPGDSIPFRIDWANSTFAHGTAPQLDLSYTSLDTTQIQKIFRCLPTVGAPSSNTKTVSVAGSTGAATLSAYARAIATAKGWKVTY